MATEFLTLCETNIGKMTTSFRATLQSISLPEGWNSVFMDMRWATGTEIAKVRMVSHSGEIIALLDTPLENVPNDIGDLFYESRKFMEKTVVEKWYGLKIIMYRDGTHRIEFDTNPECAADSTFWDD